MADARICDGIPELYPILQGSALAPGGAKEVGNKAWNLMRMARAGLPVPPAFVLPTGMVRTSRRRRRRAAPQALAQGVRFAGNRHA